MQTEFNNYGANLSQVNNELFNDANGQSTSVLDEADKPEKEKFYTHRISFRVPEDWGVRLDAACPNKTQKSEFLRRVLYQELPKYEEELREVQEFLAARRQKREEA
jgi:hypothetical protein